MLKADAQIVKSMEGSSKYVVEVQIKDDRGRAICTRLDGEVMLDEQEATQIRELLKEYAQAPDVLREVSNLEELREVLDTCIIQLEKWLSRAKMLLPIHDEGNNNANDCGVGMGRGRP